MINIGGDPNDSSYRYKMPRLVTKIEGRGNGIKTVIVNMVDVAKALHIKPSFTTKYFGLELGAQSKFDKNKERAVVNGAFDAHEMQKILTKFLGVFILCPKCDLPELRMNVKTDITADCQACGWNGPLGKGHRLSQYIIREMGGGKKKKGKKAREEKMKAAKRAPARPARASKGRAAEQRAPAKKKEEEIVWSTPATKEAQRQRKEEEFKQMRSSHVIQGGDKEDPENVDKRADQSPESFLRQMVETGASAKELIAEVRRLELVKEWDKLKKTQVIFSVLFDYNSPKQMLKVMDSQKEFLQYFTDDETSSSQFIGVLEEVVGFLQPKLLPRMPMLLQKLYEVEVLDEDSILAWFESKADPWIVGPDIAKDIRKASEPFIEWLKTAEEDESEEEEDDDE